MFTIKLDSVFNQSCSEIFVFAFQWNSQKKQIRTTNFTAKQKTLLIIYAIFSLSQFVNLPTQLFLEATKARIDFMRIFWIIFILVAYILSIGSITGCHLRKEETCQCVNILHTTYKFFSGMYIQNFS